MRFSSLGSGSAGNATLLQWEHEGLNHHLLLDCGFSERELAYRLAERNHLGAGSGCPSARRRRGALQNSFGEHDSHAGDRRSDFCQ